MKPRTTNKNLKPAPNTRRSLAPISASASPCSPCLRGESASGSSVCSVFKSAADPSLSCGGRDPRVPRVRESLKHLPVLTVQLLRVLRALCGFSPVANQGFDFHRFPTSPGRHSNRSLSFHLLLRFSPLFFLGGVGRPPPRSGLLHVAMSPRHFLSRPLSGGREFSWSDCSGSQKRWQGGG